MSKILDIMYEPDKNKYSILYESGSRKEISKKEFYEILNSKEEKAQFTGDYSLIIGRFQCVPPHEGHLALINKVLKDGNKVCLALRDSKIDKKNPYTFEERHRAFYKIYMKEVADGRMKIIKVPDIKEVVYGRKVGWGVRQIRFDEDIENISGTKIRKQRKKQ